MSQEVEFEGLVLLLLQTLMDLAPDQTFELPSESYQDQLVDRTVHHVHNLTLEMPTPQQFQPGKFPNPEQTLLANINQPIAPLGEKQSLSTLPVLIRHQQFSLVGLYLVAGFLLPLASVVVYIAFEQPNYQFIFVEMQRLYLQLGLVPGVDTTSKHAGSIQQLFFGADLLLLFQLAVYDTPYYYLVELALEVGLTARCYPYPVLVLGYGGQAGDHFLVT